MKIETMLRARAQTAPLCLLALLAWTSVAEAAPVSQGVSFSGAGNKFNGNVSGAGALAVSGNATLDIGGNASLSATVLGTAVGIGSIPYSAPTGDVVAAAIPTVGLVGGAYTSTPSGNATLTFQDNFSRQNGPLTLGNLPDGRADEGPDGLIGVGNSAMSGNVTALTAALVNAATLNPTPGSNPFVTASLSYDLFSVNLPLVGNIDVDYFIPLRFDVLPNLTLQSLNYAETSHGAYASGTPIVNYGDGAHPSGNPAVEDLSVRYSGLDAASIGTTTGRLTGSVDVNATARLSQAVIRVDVAGTIVNIPAGLLGDFTTSINNVVTGIDLPFNDTTSGFVNGTTTMLEVPSFATTPQYDDLRINMAGSSFQSAGGFALNSTGNVNFPPSAPLAFTQTVSTTLLGFLNFNITINGAMIGNLGFNLAGALGFSGVDYNFQPPTIADAVNAAPNPSFESPDIDYGYVLVGGNKTLALTVTNTTTPVATLVGSIPGTPVTDTEFTPHLGTVPFSIATFGGTASRNFTFAPADRGASSSSVTVTTNNGNDAVGLAGVGVAPQNQLSTTTVSMGNTRIGTTSNASFTVTNVGDGNFSGLGSASNLNGSVGSASGVFNGPGGGLSLPDGGSVPFGYGYTPTGHNSDVTSVLAAFTNGDNAGTNGPQNINVNLSGTGVGPEFSADQSLIDFGTVTPSLYSAALMISNISLDSALLGDALVGLTLLSYSITGADPGDFSLVGFPGSSDPGHVLSPGEDLNLLVQFNAMLPPGPRSATLTFFTDQNAAFGGSGSSFSILLQGNVVNSVVPEPSSMIVWGLLGGIVAGVTWRRRRK